MNEARLGQVSHVGMKKHPGFRRTLQRDLGKPDRQRRSHLRQSVRIKISGRAEASSHRQSLLLVGLSPRSVTSAPIST